MKFLRSVHLWLGCLFTPTLVLFVLSGALQLFGYQDSHKKTGYEAPVWIQTLSSIHTDQELSDESTGDPQLLRQFFFLACAGLILTTIMGVMLSFKMSKKKWLPALLIVLGTAIPIGLLFYYR